MRIPEPACMRRYSSRSSTRRWRFGIRRSFPYFLKYLPCMCTPASATGRNSCSQCSYCVLCLPTCFKPSPKEKFMKVRIASPATLCLLFAGITLSPAPAALGQQDAGQVHSPSKYLRIGNVELKPEQTGAYAKIEREEVEAQRAANSPNHYLTLSSITGSSHVLYMHGFESFADMQKDHAAAMAMTKLQDTLTADNASEGPMISAVHNSIYSYEQT